jgi:hypothetical protein
LHDHENIEPPTAKCRAETNYKKPLPSLQTGPDLHVDIRLLVAVLHPKPTIQAILSL